MNQATKTIEPKTESNMTSITSLGSIACIALSAALGSQKVASPGSTMYNATLASYFAVQQESMHPACFLLAESSQDVSTAVKILVEAGQSCPFAIRSGGHASSAGFSNINGGPVVDLGSLETIELGADRTSISVGVGATWGDVYETLDPLGLSVNGGRASNVDESRSIGGLTLGSGLSYTSPRYGWTCDTVSQFEVVLADGSIVEANSTSNPDLLWALKGGSNNFGIVTRITLDVFQQGLVWSGSVYSLTSNAQDVIDNFVAFNSPTSYDEYASVITSFVYTASQGGLALATNLLQYTKEVNGTPPVFESFLATPSIYNATSVGNMTVTSKATAASNPSAVRVINLAKTLVSNKSVIQAAYDKWAAAYPAITGVNNIVFSLVLEPLPPVLYKRHAADNALGLADRAESLIVALIFVSWSEASDDALVHSTANSLFDGIVAAAQELGGLDPYIFMNYAGKRQAVIESYGNASVSRLRHIRDEVDPKGAFTNQVPGGFKIPES